MHDRRFEPRLPCSAATRIEPLEANISGAGWEGIFHDISLSGARLHMSAPIPVLIPVRLVLEDRVLKGTIRYCTRKDTVYIVGLEFDVECTRTAAAIMRGLRKAGVTELV